MARPGGSGGRRRDRRPGADRPRRARGDGARRTGAGVLVLVSCDPASLGRDAKLLGRAGYRLEWSEVVDTFPQTTHVEAVSRFTAAADR